MTGDSPTARGQHSGLDVPGRVTADLRVEPSAYALPGAASDQIADLGGPHAGSQRLRPCDQPSLTV